MTRRFFLATLITCLAIAPRAFAEESAASADELAAARRDGVSCRSLDDAEHFRSPTLARVTAKACKRDRWKLEVVVCFLRDYWSDCDDALPARARARYEKDVARADGRITQENRQWAIESARKAGILGDQRVVQGGAFASLHGTAPVLDEDGNPIELPPPAPEPRWAPPEPTPEELAARAARDAIEAWVQPAYERCTDRSRNLTITVTIRSNACTDLKVTGERRSGPITKCLRTQCATADWSKVPDITHAGHGRTGPTDWSK
jgi:hypothetical protein